MAAMVHRRRGRKSYGLTEAEIIKIILEWQISRCEDRIKQERTRQDDERPYKTEVFQRDIV